jgi:hypothetical protein
MSLKFEKPEPLPVDPLVAALTEAQIEADIAAYLELLDREAPESEVHDFLANHSYFFNCILRMYGVSPIYSKVRLGSQYEVDFAFFDTGSFGPEWCLVEIEAPSKRMFTLAGDPTADLTHGIQQVRDWHTWIHDNLDYVRKLMPQIEYPLGYVFIGRRSHLTPETMKKLRRLAHDHRMTTRIHTLDWFEGAARSVRSLVRAGQGGTWPVPMRAMSHADFAAGRPDMAREWLSDPRVARDRDFGRELVLNQRKYSYLNLAEYQENEADTE